MKYTHDNGTPFTREEFLQKLKTDKEFNDEFNNQGIDQIKKLLDILRTNPDSRRMLGSAWNVTEIEKMTVPPCHFAFQFYTRKLTREERVELVKKKKSKLSTVSENDFKSYDIPEREISIQWYQRSVDVGLGLPFNIASYALLLLLYASETGMKPGIISGAFGDTHIYKDHIEGLKEQITRTPYELPEVQIPDGLFSGKEEIKLVNYKSHGRVNLPLSN